MNVYFLTFGCKVNQYETAALAELFAEHGFTVCDSPDNADICVVNTCTVTAESDSKAAQAVRKMRRLLPGGIIAVTGCLPQARGGCEDILPEADIVTGTKDRRRLPLIVAGFIENHIRTVCIPHYQKNDPFEDMSCRTLGGHTRAFLKIQDGCDRFCSYCIIPYSRGRIRSKAPADLERDIGALAGNGFSEIVLTGINLAFYGKEYGLDLADAVRICAADSRIRRIRLSSLEPEMLSDDLIEKLAEISALCPSFHLSLQSGSEKILRAMNRKYSPADFSEIAEKLRRRFPGCSLTTDIMTGFPSETEEDHLDSLRFVKDIGFAKLHVFPYSVRPGTRAADMPEQIPQEIKHRRAAEMSALGEKLHAGFLESHIGGSFPVLFEREKNDGFHRGYTPDYTYVKILTKNSQKSLRKNILYVTIDRIENGCCIGHLTEMQTESNYKGASL